MDSGQLSFVRVGKGHIAAQAADYTGIPGRPGDLITLLFPSFWLALAFVILMVKIYQYAPQERKVWAHVGLIFAIMYATLNTTVYMPQMMVSTP